MPERHAGLATDLTKGRITLQALSATEMIRVNLIQSTLKHGAALRRQTAAYTGNAFDRVFHAAAMVQAGQTPYEVLAAGGLVSLGYYPRLSETEIELADWLAQRSD